LDRGNTEIQSTAMRERGEAAIRHSLLFTLAPIFDPGTIAAAPRSHLF
jgi:hypothetical protein